ncbi:MAG: ATP-dependent helicase [Rhodocyclaceae bacterium]|jgi:superfamily I DNA/RNA helicase|nr:ATP-dependent helicase [Rhodocyclaceae bacterium]
MLNADQYAAATYPSSVMLIAPPGSGKTTTMVARIEHIRNARPASHVVAVSFTRDSADELHDRIVHSLGEWGADHVQSGTFHSLCKDQLQAAGIRTTLIEEFERVRYLNKAVASMERPPQFDNDDDRYEMLGNIEREKMARALGRSCGDHTVERVTTAYQAELAEAQVADFQDLIIQAVQGMRDGLVTPLKCAELTIDEFQDIDELQLEWAFMTIDANRATAFAVGDDDQSIFGFRLAMGIEAIRRFVRKTNAKQLLLRVNYRSHVEIVEAATRLIRANQARNDKDVVAHTGKGAGISFTNYNSMMAEAESVASAIIHADRSKHTFAVLARERRPLLGIQAYLSAAGVPHRSVGKSIWKEQPVRLLLVALGMVAGVKVRDSLVEALFEFVGADEDEAAAAKHVRREVWLRGAKAQLPRVAKHASVIAFLAHFEAWNRLASDDDKVDVAVFGVKTWLQTHLPKSAQRDQEMVELAAAAVMRMQRPLKARLAYLTQVDQKRDANANVTLATFHGAKGLEWDVVIAVAADHDKVPHQKSEISEERRLFYVASTRARKRYAITSGRGIPSPFVIEAFPTMKDAIYNGGFQLGATYGVELPRPSP